MNPTGWRAPDPRVRETPHEAMVGEMVEVESLLAWGGKFYEVDSESYCDTPTATFKLVSPLDPGMTRIE